MPLSRLLVVICLLGTIGNNLFSQIENRRGDVIPGTAEISLGPGIDLSNWNEPSRNLQSAFIRQADLTDADFSHSWLDHSSLVANFANATFDHASLTGSFFDESDLSGSRFIGANLTRTTFEQSNLAGANFEDAELKSTRFVEVANLAKEQIYSTANYKSGELRDVHFALIGLREIDFSSVNLEGSGFSNSDLSDAQFANANLNEAYFQHTELSRANLDGATIANATFNDVVGLSKDQIYSTESYANRQLGAIGFRDLVLTQIDLSDQQLIRARFSDTNLERANFRGADLSNSSFQNSPIDNANFTDTVIDATSFYGRSKLTSEMLYSTNSYTSGNLVGIRLFDQNMTGWQLSGKDLSGARFDRSPGDDADFTDANLSDAWFEESTLRGVDFSRANLTDARFDRIRSFQNTRFDDAIIRDAQFLNTDISYEQLSSTRSFREGVLHGVELNGTNLSRGNFDNLDLTDSIFIDTNLSNSSFQRADLTRAAIVRSRVAGADFEDAILHETFLQGSASGQLSNSQFESTASFEQKKLRGIRIVQYNMDGWDFRNQDLTGSSFYSSNLRNADFTSADMTDVSFYDTPLRDANFTDAIVDGVDFSDWSRNPIEFSIQQLYPSRSYQNGHLRRMRFSEANLANAIFTGIDLTESWFANANITDADFTDATIDSTTFSDSLSAEQLRSTKSYQDRKLLGITFYDVDLSNVDFSHQDLTGVRFEGVNLTGADMTNANIEGATFYLVGDNAADQFREIQLPSTRSFKERNLRGVAFQNNHLTGMDLSSFDLTNASFDGDLTDVDFTDAEISGARFWGDRTGALSKKQLYSTASYQRGDLERVRLNEMRIAGWDFANQDLARADFEESTIVDSDFTDAFLVNTDFEDADLIRTRFDRADLRDADDAWEAEQMGSNMIRQEGIIDGLNLVGEETLIVRDYPKPITIEQEWKMDSTAGLELRLRSSDWGSTINVSNAIDLQLDGTLRLTLDQKADASQLAGLTFDLFNWESEPAEDNRFATFETAANFIWDLNDLYSTGEVVLRGLESEVRGDFDADGTVSARDIDLLSAAIRSEFSSEPFDLDSNQVVNQSDRRVWMNEVANIWIGDANFDGEFNSADFVDVFRANEYEDDLVKNSTWATGDWDGDGEFASSDLVVAFQAGGYEKGPRAIRRTMLVPESLCPVRLLLAGMWSIGVFQRWRQANESPAIA